MRLWRRIIEGFYLFRRPRKAPYEVRILATELEQKKRAFLVVIQEFSAGASPSTHPVALLGNEAEAEKMATEIGKELEAYGVEKFLKRWAERHIPPAE